MQKDRHLGSVKFAYLQWSHCTYFDVTSASPIFVFTSLASPWPILLEQAQYLASEPAVFYSERVSHGHLQWEICHELQRAPWMVLLCFARASLPRGQSSSGIGHTPILSKTYHVIMKSLARFAHVTRTADSSLKWALFRSITRDLLGDLPMRKKPFCWCDDFA